VNPSAGDLFPGSLMLSALGALWAWLLALLLGASLLRFPEEDTDIDRGGRLLAWTVLGIVVETQVWFVLSTFGVLRPLAVVATASLLTVAGVLLGGRRLKQAWDVAAPVNSARGVTFDSAWLAALSSIALGLFLLTVARLTTWPTVFYDDLVYHVAAPRQALLTGTWPAMPGMHYSFMPAGWDAAYLLPLAMGGGLGPQMMNLLCLGLLIWTVYRLGLNGGGTGAAMAATALLIIAPMFTSLGAFAGNDLYVGLALAVAADRLVATSGRKPFSIGLLTGAAWGAKYSALPGAAGIGLAAAVISGGAVVKRLSRLAIVGGVTLLVAAAWTIRSFVLTGNPLYPAFYGIFGGEYWNPQSAAVVAETVSHGGLANRGLSAFALALVDLIAHSDGLGFPSGINPMFVVAALVGLLFWKKVRGGAGLLIVAAVCYAGWCVTSLNLRYVIVLLAVLTPFAAALMQQVVVFSERPNLRRMLAPVLPVLLLLAVAGPFIQGVNRHLQAYGEGTTFIGDTPARDMQVSRIHLAAAGREMAKVLPPEARILLVAEGRVGLLPRPALASSAYDHPDIARYAAGARSVEELNGRLTEFTHVVVNFRELARFEKSFGFVERFNPGEWELFRLWLAEGLEPQGRFGNVVVYRIPRNEPMPGTSSIRATRF